LTEKQAWEPLRVSIGDSRIAVVNISEGEDLTTARGAAGVCGWDHARTLSTIRQCKREGAFVIVIAHCGVEYIPFPPPYVAQEFRSMVDAGADCVIGHHPHVPQGIEWRRKRPVVYSMGNFVFYQFTDLYYRKTGFFVRIGVSGNSLSGFSVHPYRINEHGLQALAGAEARSFRRKLAVLSAPLSRPRGVEKAWSAYLDYYGTSGFTAEVQGILAKLKEEPEKGAAMFRNRLTTLQHAELWRDFLTRIMAGTVHSPSAPITRLIREWFARKAVSGAA
jgi:poly-gamma-glutamate synthesis protein (capsule biosynthesis protein)